MLDSDYWRSAPRRLADDRKLVAVLGLLILALYLPNLGGYGLFDPWETHYGEVARTMVETDNYIDPWWGSPWDPTGVKREREGFYSKPPLTLWLMAAGMQVAGHSALGVRLLFPLLAALALLAVYLSVSRFTSRRTGLIATVVLGSSPFYALMSRQAVTDGPLVSVMTLGMMALAFGLFGVQDDDEAAGRGLRWTVSLLLVAVMGWQLFAMLPMDRSPDILRAYPGDAGLGMRIQWFFRELLTVGAGKGWFIALALLPICAYATWRVARERRRRILYIYLFYIACGLTVPAKGWAGWAPMGGAIVTYLLVTGEWRTLLTVQVPMGLLIVFVTGHPWVIAMLGGHHPEWFKRFWIHDHVNRLFSGVHSTDDGGFEYFIQWIGYGLFPWIGLLPAGVARILGGLRRRAEGYTPRERFELLLFLWALFAFFMFTKSSTKFHHYIFPAIPPLAILAALYLGDLLDGRAKAPGVLLGAGAAIVAWIGLDVARLPAAYGHGAQSWVNLFTYKYDRQWPLPVWDAQLAELEGEALENALFNNQWLQDLTQPVLWITLIGIAGYLLMALFRDWKRSYGAQILGVAGLWMAFFALHTYLPKISGHWSQEELWDAYYDQCTPFEGSEADWSRHLLLTAQRVPVKADHPRKRCVEPIVAYRMNWRGETFYSSNTVLPAIETKHLEPFLKAWGEERPFYLFTERSRVKGELEPHLPETLKGRYAVVFGKNRKFVLLRISRELPPEGAEAAAAKPF